MRTICAAAVVATLLLTGCIGQTESEPTPATFGLLGTLDLNKPMPLADEGQSCSGSGGYSDIAPGAQVKVSDASGAVVAIGELGNGFARKTYEQLPPNVCQFAIVMDDIPDGGDGIYGVEVANRGVINFKKEGSSATVQMSLG